MSDNPEVSVHDLADVAVKIQCYLNGVSGEKRSIVLTLEEKCKKRIREIRIWDEDDSDTDCEFEDETQNHIDYILNTYLKDDIDEYFALAVVNMVKGLMGFALL